MESVAIFANFPAMLKNYLKTTLRNLFNNKTYSFLNLAGLAIGVACAGLIFLWVEYETHYDRQYQHYDRLAQVMTNQTYDGIIRTFQSTPGQLGPALVKEVPGIENAARTSQRRALFTIGEKNIFEKGFYTDSSFFPMFSLDFLQGSPDNAFKQLYAVVISEKMAGQFFAKDASIIGKTIRVDNKQDYIVTGVFKDLAPNSTLQFEWLSPWAVFESENGWLKRWGANGPRTYVQLAPAATVGGINKSIAGFIHAKDEKVTTIPIALAMSDWHLRNNFTGGRQTGGRIEFVQLFGIIAWIILIIACINFMNLATARSAKRAREVGVRKVLGAGKRSLVIQFIGEAIILSFISVCIGILLIRLLLPAFNALIETKIALELTSPVHIAAALIITVFCGIVAGSYPSFYLSSFNPIFVFKGLRLKTGSAASVRRGLVGFQFTISTILIICTILVYQQVMHIKTRDIGYKKDHLLEVELTGTLRDHFDVIRQNLLNSGQIENAALCNTSPLYTANNTTGFEWEGKNQTVNPLVSYRPVSPGYLSTMGMQLKEGRDFNTDYHSDSTNVLITESFARFMGSGSALGKIIRSGTDKFTVVGVVKDYVYGDMYGTPDPVIFFSQPANTDYLYIRIRDNAGLDHALGTITSIIKKENPGYPFEYSFVDDQFDTIFKSETLIGNLSRIFAVLAIIISCLGLFGLAAYTAEQRAKEISIRKVLGARAGGIVAMLSKDFLNIVIVSIIIAAPIAFYIMQHWLRDFSYRITISWWVFVFAGSAAIIIALGTVSFQAIRAAVTNPVKCLRSE